MYSLPGIELSACGIMFPNQICVSIYLRLSTLLNTLYCIEIVPVVFIVVCGVVAVVIASVIPFPVAFSEGNNGCIDLYFNKRFSITNTWLRYSTNENFTIFI